MKENYSELSSLFDTVLQTSIGTALEDGKNFLEMGGDSIKAMHLIAKAREMGYDISMEEILSGNSLKELLADNKLQAMDRWEKYRSGIHILTCKIQESYNEMTIHINSFDLKRYHMALQKLVHKHELLRTVRDEAEVTIISESEFDMTNADNCFKFSLDDNGNVFVKADGNLSDRASLLELYTEFCVAYEKQDEFDETLPAPYFAWQALKDRLKKNYAFYSEKKQCDDREQIEHKYVYTCELKKSEISPGRILKGYERYIIQRDADKGQYALNFYNPIKNHISENVSFQKSLGNYQVPSQYLFYDNALVSYDELCMQNNYYESSQEKTYGFAYNREVDTESSMCKLVEIKCKEQFFDDYFLEVYETPISYHLVLHTVYEEVDAVKQLTNFILEEESEDALLLGNIGGDALDREHILHKYGSENIDKIYRLLDIHKGMLFHSLEHANSEEYKMQYHIHMGFYMDEELVRESINIIAKKYPALRTSIAYKGLKEPMQVVLKNKNPEINVIEVKGDITQELIKDCIEKDLKKEVDLEESPLFSVTIINNYKEMDMIWNFHHVIVDGWSMPLIFGDFHKFYEDLLYGEDINYFVNNSYENHINKTYVKDINEGLDFWMDYLSDYNEDTEICPLNHPTVKNDKKESYVLKLDQDKTNRLKRYADDQNVTLNTLMELALSIVLFYYNNSKDIVYARVTSGRDLTVEGISQAVGMFVNTLPMRVINNNEKISGLLEQISHSHRKIEKYDYCSLAQISKKLGVNPTKILYVFENFMNVESLMKESDGVEFKNLRDDTNYDLNFILSNQDTIEWKVVYNESLYSINEMERLGVCIENALDAILEKDNLTVNELDLIPQKDQEKILYEFNDTRVTYPQNITIGELFEKTVDEYPENIALVDQKDAYTYREIFEMVCKKAKEFHKNGIRRGDRVCIYAKKNIETIVNILALIKLEAVYIPIDLQNPEQRNEYILKNANPSAVIDAEGETKYFIEAKGRRNRGKQDDCLAYMMYTSGTSGEPKGVQITQKGIIRLVKNTTYMPLDSETCMIQCSSLAFDASTFEIWGTLLNGGKLCLLDSEDVVDAGKLSKAIERLGVNTMFLTTALFNQMMDIAPTMLSGLKYLAIGGEKISEKHARLFQKYHPETVFLNVYGPTENTTFTTGGPICEEGLITIGKPITNTQVYIMNHGKLCPIGVYGELCTTGAGVAKGYFKDQELTEKVFVKSPFGDGMMYCTKDKARWTENGEIEFGGRIDKQVKIRGFRMEPEEISRAVEHYRSIKRCVTVIDEAKNIKSYFVADECVDLVDLFSFLKQELPDYMIPRKYLQLEELPITTNGKIDYRRLPEETETVRRSYIAPSNENEKNIVEAFETVLSLERIGMDDDFIEMGGNSLMAVRLANELEKRFSKRIELRYIMQERTPGRILQKLESLGTNSLERLTVAEKKSVYEMSSVQKRMFISQKTVVDNIQYNIPVVLKFKQKIDVEKMTYALQTLVSRHEILRTKFGIRGDIFVQDITDEELEVKKFSMPLEHALKEFIAPFDLEKEIPFRAAVCLGEEDYLLMDVHHIAGDGTSSTIMLQEILTLYHGGTLQDVEHQYKDYSEWMLAHSFEKEKNFWLGKFEEEVTPIDLPYDYERKNGYDTAGETIVTKIKSEEISRIAKEYHVTEYVVFLTAWIILLNRYSRQEDITVGTPVSGRMHPGMEHMLGMFVNTLPLRVLNVNGQNVEDLLRKINSLTYEAFENQEYPLYELIESLGVVRDTNRQPLFDVIFALRDDRDEAVLNGFDVETVSITSKTSKFDLFMEVRKKSDGYELALEYSCNLFASSTVQRMLNNYVTIVSNLYQGLLKPVEEISIISAAEQKQIEKWNQTYKAYERNSCIQDVFMKVVNLYSDKIALWCENQQYTYAQVDRLSDRIAVALRKQNVKPQDVVAVEATKSVETVLSILGIIKAGAVYVPIETGMPEEKTCFMLQDSNAILYICDSKDYKFEGIQNISYRKLVEDAPENPNISYINAPTDNVYYMYTSGTTGNPKATMVSHRNILRLVRNTNFVELNSDTRMILGGSIAFDASTLEIWGPLLNGGTLYLTQLDTLVSPKKLSAFIEENRINTMWMTSSLFNQMIEWDSKVFGGLTYLMIGGEKLSEYHVRKMREHNPEVVLINGYGPTENTTFTTTYEIPENFDKLYIGKPVANTQVYILQNNELCPIGVYGELCTTGDGVSNGYLNRPELTQERFTKNPFGEGRMYRTGDIARYDVNGNIEYLGRADSQVKIRGFRVELCGIEDVIKQYPGISQAAVVVSNEKQLKAYYVANESIVCEDLYHWLRKQLPSYSVPTLYLQIEKLPLTVNGKLDYRKLPKDMITVKNEYIAPETETEKYITSLFEKILGLTGIGTQDNFFEMGGHSLKATLVCNQIEKKFDICVGIGDIFQYPTAGVLAAFIDEKVSAEGNGIESAPLQEMYEASSAQKRIYFACKMNRNALLYNMPMIFKCAEPLDEKKTKEAFVELIKRHSALRTVYVQQEGTIYQKVIPSEDIVFNIEHEKKENFIRPFSLEEAPMIRVSLTFEQGENYICIDVHHIAADGFGMGVLVKEFIQLYQDKKLPSVLQYYDYSEWMKTVDLESQRKYWLEKYEEEIPVLNLYTDHKREAAKLGKGASKVIAIPEDTSVKITRIANKYGMSEYMVYLAVTSILLGRFGYSDEFVLGSVMANRTRRQLEGIVGMFANTIPLKVAPKATMLLSEFMEEIKSTTVDAMRNQEYPFDRLIDELKIKRDPTHNPLFDVMFVYQAGLQDDNISSLGLSYVDDSSYVAKFDLTINMDKTDMTYLKFEYDVSLFDESTIDRMMSSFINIANHLENNSENRLCDIPYILKDEVDYMIHGVNPEIIEIDEKKCIHEMFEAEAFKNPEKVAVEFGEKNYTYQEINHKADIIASTLLQKGMRKGDYIVVLAHRRPETIMAFLGILKAGGVYVPIDPAWPQERKDYVFSDCNAKYVLGHMEEEVNVSDNVLIIDDITSDNKDVITFRENSLMDVAYCIYTSGTSGKPKGVLVPHEGVGSLREYFKVSQDIMNRPRVLQFASFSFDASISEICMSILSGNTMVMVPDDIKYDSKAFEKFLVDRHVDIGIIPPQYLAMLGETNLKTIISAGSETNMDIVAAHSKNNIYSNDYGPTETTVCATYWKYEGEEPIPFRIPIGKPIFNKQVYIMNEGQLCGTLVPGEICIAGDGIAVGYLNREKLTEEKFIDNPYGKGKMYRTGDLGRWNEKGEIEYLGRIDNQIKIRGFRVEVSEIQKVLMEIPNVTDAAVIAHKKTNGEDFLIGFIKTDDINYGSEDVRMQLSQKLPAYMVPSKIVMVDEIPVNSSGKLNRNKLIELYQEYQAKLQENTDYSTWTKAQKLVKKIWEETLEEEIVALDTDFFDMGGNSLNLFTVSEKLEEMGIIASISDLYQYTTVEALAIGVVEAQLSQEAVVTLKPIHNSSVYVSNLRQNTDSFNWQEINCYYKPRAIAHGKFDSAYYLNYLTLFSLCSIYQVNGLFSSFDMYNRQPELEEFERQYIAPYIGTISENLEFENLPEQEEFNEVIRAAIRKDKPVIIAGNGGAIYYSNDYMREPHSHYFLIKGYNDEKKIWHILDTLQYDFGCEPIYREFVITYDLLYESVLSYRDNIEVRPHEAYFTAIGRTKETVFTQNKFVSLIVDIFEKMNDKSVSYQYINVALLQYLSENREKLMKMDSDIRRTQLSYISSLMNIRPVFFKLMGEILEQNYGEDELSKYISEKDIILDIWENAKVLIWDLISGKEVDIEKLQNILNEGVAAEETLRRKLVMLLKPTLKAEDNMLEEMANDKYVINPLKAEIDLCKDSFKVHLSSNNRYDMWNTEFDAVRLGKNYQDSDFVVETKIKINNIGKEKYQDGIAVHFDDGTLVLFGPTYMADKVDLHIFYPAIEKSDLYEEFWGKDTIQLKVESTRGYLTFSVKKENEYIILMRMKPQGKVTKAELFTRTWEKYEHIAYFTDIVMS